MALTKVTKDVIDIPGVSAAFQADTTVGGLRSYVDTQNTAQTLASITASGATTSSVLTLNGAVTVNSVFTINDTSAVKIPVGTGAQRPGAAAAGMLRYVTDGTTPGFEGYNGTTWGSISGGGGGGVTIADDTTTSAIYYPTFSTITSGALSTAKVSSTKLTFNPGTGELFATTFNSSSDRTLKTNIETITNAAAIVDQMTGVSFDWISNGKKSYGFIAQDLEQVLPDVVMTNQETGLKSVNYDATIAVLLEAIKELTARVAHLESI